MTEVRKGQAPKAMARSEFALRFRAPFSDPAFEPARDAISRLEEIAWRAYSEGRKAPVTRKAVRELRAGRLQAAKPRLPQPRPK